MQKQSNCKKYKNQKSSQFYSDNYSHKLSLTPVNITRRRITHITEMAYYIRPTSIDLQVKRLDSNSVPMKQKEILGELLEIIEEIPDLERKQIRGFQRNNPNSFTITLNTETSKEIRSKYLKTNPKGENYMYTPKSADIITGRLTLTGIPVEYQDTTVETILSEYIQVAKIRHGTYNDFPDIENGLRHVAYKHKLKAIPTKLTLPEGIHFYTKEEKNDIRCYLCSGNHLRRNCKLQPILSTLQDQEKAIHQNKPTEVVDFVTLAKQPFTFPVYNTEQPVQSKNRNLATEDTNTIQTIDDREEDIGRQMPTPITPNEFSGLINTSTPKPPKKD